MMLIQLRTIMQWHLPASEIDHFSMRLQMQTFKILADYVRTSNAQRPLSEEAARLKTLYGQADPNEAELERQLDARDRALPE